MATENKYTSILLAAKTLFWKYGFKRVNIEDICKQASCSKGTFYKYFPNKLELAKRVFDYVVTDSMQSLQQILQSNTQAHDKLTRMLELKLNGVHDISQEFLADFYNNPDVGIKTYIEQRTAVLSAEILQSFVEAQQQGVFRKDLNIPFFFYISQQLSAYMHDPVVLSFFDSPEKMIMELATLLVHGIAPDTKQL